MTKDEALKLALDALETSMYPQQKQLQAITAIKESLANEALEKMAENARELGLDYEPAQEPVAWKLVPRDATDEMLKAMDECSTEGYDERLYAGHAASVYMAAVDVAPTPPQRKPEQEPCTKVECMGSKGCIGNCWNKKQPQQELVCVCGAVWEGEELIYTPPQRKPLTDEEMQRMAKRIEELEAMLEQQTARIVDLQTHIANLEGE